MSSAPTLSSGDGLHRALIDSMDDGICVLEPFRGADGRDDFRYVAANAAVARQSGVEDVVGHTVRQMIPAEADEWIRTMKEVLQTGRSVRFERDLVQTGRVLEANVLRLDHEGRPHVSVVFRDITGRARTDRAYALLSEVSARRQRLYETALSNTPDLVYVFDLQHRFTYANEALLRMWGRHWNDAIGKNCLELGYEPWHAEMHDREIEMVKATKRPIRGEVPFTGRNGRRIYDYIFVPVLNAEGEIEAVAGTARDVTERKAGEEALRVSTQQFEVLLNAAPLGVYLIDADFRLAQINPSARKTFGDIPNVIGRDFSEILRILWPADDASEFERIFRRTMETGERYTSPEYGQVREDKGVQEYYQFELDRIPLPDGRHGVVCYFQDVSFQVNARHKIEETAENLARSNKELEQFAYVASHDLQEPLRMVANYLQLLERSQSGKLDASAKKYIGHAVNGAVRMKALIEDLLAYSHASFQKWTPQAVAMDGALEEALGALRESISDSGAAIERDPLPTVSGHETLLTQLFQNLVGNAIKYRGEAAPRVHVSASRDGAEWRFSVRDNGIGIAPEFQDRIFGMFQRLHSRKEYSGTGIGLAICKKIVERHGGRIWVNSQPGGGSTFYFTLPAA